jgi:multidrug efflux pump subunit AcrB
LFHAPVEFAGAVPGAIAGWFAYRPVNRILSRFFKLFNRGFDAVTGWYGRAVSGLLRISVIALLIYGGLLDVAARMANALTALGIAARPGGESEASHR